MTLTASQVQDIQTTIKGELEAGTWTLYGSLPQIHTEAQKKSSKNTWIEVLNSRGDIIYAFNNTPIYFNDVCELRINCPNRTDMNKLYADVINIFSASSKNITIEGPRDIPLRNKYKKTMNVRLVDI